MSLIRTVHNRHRDRKVPTAIIEAMHTELVAFPPDRAEGFTRLNLL